MSSARIVHNVPLLLVHALIFRSSKYPPSLSPSVSLSLCLSVSLSLCLSVSRSFLTVSSSPVHYLTCALFHIFDLRRGVLPNAGVCIVGRTFAQPGLYTHPLTYICHTNAHTYTRPHVYTRTGSQYPGRLPYISPSNKPTFTRILT